MDLQEAEDLACEHMAEWLPGHWTFGWNNHRSDLGVCNFKLDQIQLSAPLCEVNTREVMEETILHEIAHALTGRCDGEGNVIPDHGKEWKEWARAVGAEPRATARPGETVLLPRPPHKWEIRCPSCGHVVHRIQRMSKTTRSLIKRPLACKLCCEEHNDGAYDARFKFKLYQMH